MSERPIIFSAPMVRAILEGRKTMTRRILSPNNLRVWTGGLDHRGRYVKPNADTFAAAMNNARDFRMIEILLHWVTDPAPHQSGSVMAQWMGRLTYAPGDRLWVREAWRTLQKWDCLKPRHLADDIDKVKYEVGPDRNPLWAWGRYRHARFMPRWASRINLLVADVRVERLHDISEDDARAEGVDRTGPSGLPDESERDWGRQKFAALWRFIHSEQIPVLDEDGRKIGMQLNPARWDANPWVAAVSFTRVTA